MKVFYGFDNLEIIKNAVVTTGTFDGVHIGHKTIIRRIRNLAAEYNGESVLISFHPHPRKVLYPNDEGKNLQMITTLGEKIELLEKEGLDNLVLVRFTPEFSRISSHNFINDFVFARLKPRVVVAGFNHHFGYNKEGDYRYLNQVASSYGFIAEEIPEQEIHNETVSSTEIRKALADGYIQRVNAYLDHYYFFTGKNGDDNKECNETGDCIFILRIENDDKLLPRDGYYAVSLPFNDSGIRGLATIPTKKSGFREVKIIAFNTDRPYKMTGEQLKVNFHKRIGSLITGGSPGKCPVPENIIEEAKELIF